MDYFVSKLRLIYFSTFSGNRFNPDQIKIITPELVAAGHFKNRPSQEMPFGTLKEMPHRFPFFQQRPHTSASLFHSRLCPRGSAPSVKPKQTARPRRPPVQCSVVPRPALEGLAAAREAGMCWSTGWQPAGSPPPRTGVPSPGRSSIGRIPAAHPPKPVQSLRVAGCHPWGGQAPWDR